jgi:hypothetical protein
VSSRVRRFCAGVGYGALDSSKCAKPRIAFSGVRSSWLIPARKFDLARFARSAAAIVEYLARVGRGLPGRGCGRSVGSD